MLPFNIFSHKVPFTSGAASDGLLFVRVLSRNAKHCFNALLPMEALMKKNVLPEVTELEVGPTLALVSIYNVSNAIFTYYH